MGNVALLLLPRLFQRRNNERNASSGFLESVVSTPTFLGSAKHDFSRTIIFTRSLKQRRASRGKFGKEPVLARMALRLWTRHLDFAIRFLFSPSANSKPKPNRASKPVS